MNDYSYRDIMRMQKEAKARVMEMQRRSRFLAEDFAGGEARAESGERNAEIARGALPRQRPENAESWYGTEESRERRARAIRMPVELPERREVSAESGERSSEFGVRNSESRQASDAVGTASVFAETAAAGRAVSRNASGEGAGLSAALRNVFGRLDGEETEKMFLLALCLLLHQENGDEGLLLAMMYLLT